MNSTLYIITPILSLTLTLILMFPLRALAIQFKLVDKPNNRKVHLDNTPLIGGLLIFISTGLALVFSNEFWANIQEYYTLVLGSLLLLLVGVIDDKMDVKASLKFIIQVVLAYFIIESGVMINSLYGILGIYELPILVQYLLTTVIIVGVTNSFNLMDGIDGLVAGLAIIGLLAYTYSYIAILLGDTFLALVFMTITGALVGFLRYNLSIKNKIFMGDAGSLVIGFILVVSGIILIQTAKETTAIIPTLSIIIGVLILPVADSIRVYFRRVKNGISPFNPDKTHIHHLVLLLNPKHKLVSFIVVLFSASLILISIVFTNVFGLTITLLMTIMFFAIVLSILMINQEIGIWKTKLVKLENR